MTVTLLEIFRARVLGDECLTARLSALDNPAAFVAACLALADEWGIPLDPETIASAMRDNRRAWREANAVGASE